MCTSLRRYYFFEVFLFIHDNVFILFFRYSKPAVTEDNENLSKIISAENLRK